MIIDSSDIVDQRLKLILGLIWMLILHYSISMPIWDEGSANGHAPEWTNGSVNETPKQRLLNWIQSKVNPFFWLFFCFKKKLFVNYIHIHFAFLNYNQKFFNILTDL